MKKDYSLNYISEGLNQDKTFFRLHFFFVGIKDFKL